LEDDLFGEWLKAVIHQKQGRRKEILAELDPLRKELSALDREISLLEEERDRRTHPVERVEVPDYPPEEAELPEDVRELQEEEIAHYDGLDLSVPVKSKAYRQQTLSAVRDWFYANRTRWVKTGVIADDLNIPRTIVTRRCQDLLDNGTLQHQGNRASSKYKFNQELPAGPKVLPAESLT
jgi:hypothetical protein